MQLTQKSTNHMQKVSGSFWAMVTENNIISKDVIWSQKSLNPLGPRPAAALSLQNPLQKEVTVSNDPGIQL